MAKYYDDDDDDASVHRRDDLDECRKCFHACIPAKEGHFSILCESRVYMKLSLFG